MIYDRVLTENEAESFYDSNITPENGIVLHYNFQEGGPGIKRSQSK